jgi:hypothetical protein
MGTHVVAILRALRGGYLRPCCRGGHESKCRRSPDQWGPDPVHEYQVHVFHDPKLSPHSTEGQAASLRFLRSGNVRKFVSKYTDYGNHIAGQFEHDVLVELTRAKLPGHGSTKISCLITSVLGGVGFMKRRQSGSAASPAHHWDFSTPCRRCSPTEASE